MAQEKRGTVVSLTYEMLRAVLGLPKEVEVVAIIDKPERDLLTLKLRAPEESRFSHVRAEGMEYMNVTLDSDLMYLRALEMVGELHEQAEGAEDDHRAMNARYVLAMHKENKLQRTKEEE